MAILIRCTKLEGKSAKWASEPLLKIRDPGIQSKYASMLSWHKAFKKHCIHCRLYWDSVKPPKFSRRRIALFNAAYFLPPCSTLTALSDRKSLLRWTIEASDFC